MPSRGTPRSTPPRGTPPRNTPSPRSSPPREQDHLDWTNRKEIGKGTTGILFKVPLRTPIGNEEHRAIKWPLPGKGGSITNERGVFEHLGQHNNIVRYYGHAKRVVNNETQETIELEYFDGSPLADHLHEKYFSKSTVVPSENAKRIVRQILAGLAHVHSKGYMHRDIKLNNFMINKSETVVKIIDFGEATPKGSSGWVPRHPGATPAFLGPESWENGVMGTPTDMWALGVSLFQMFLGLNEYPFGQMPPNMPAIRLKAEQDAKRELGNKATDKDVKNKTAQELKKHYAESKIPWGAWQATHAAEAKFLKKLLAPDTGARYKASEALSDPWVN